MYTDNSHLEQVYHEDADQISNHFRRGQDASAEYAYDS